MKLLWKSALIATCCALAPLDAYAQLNGNNLRGDFGVGSGTQPAPGLYASFLYFNYDTDTIRDRHGDRINSSGEVTVQGFAPLATWVGKGKVLGATYGVMAVLPFANNALEAPAFGLNRGSGVGLADMYVRPVELGWRSPRADATAGIGLYLPTGRYEADADDNTGLGMTGFEIFAGTTVYLDQAKTLSIATTGFWETHSEKKDSDTTVGDVLTLEGGIGKSFLGGGASLGVAYYAQWKLTADEFGRRFPSALAELNKHRTFALGPDVTLPIAMKQKLVALVNVRAQWEVASRSTTEGRMIVVTGTFPIPSIPIK
jgi:hypothetical protein